MKEYLNGKCIGEINDGVLIVIKNSSSHFYKKGRGYAINNALLHKAKELGVERIRVVEVRKDGSVKRYGCSLQKYLNAVMIVEPNFEPQRCVPLIELEVLNQKLEEDKHE